MLKRVLLFILLFSPNLFFAQAQGNLTYTWSYNLKAFEKGGYTIGNALAKDINGNVYVTGTFSGTADFDPSSSVANLTAQGGNDIFVAKYDSLGNYIFAKRIGGNGDDLCTSIVLDPSNSNFYITGNFYSVVDFDPSSNTATLSTTSTNANDYDIFLAKYDANGNYIFANSYGGVRYDQATSIAIDNTGAVCIAGSFSGTVDFDPSANTSTLSAPLYCMYFAKYSSTGSYILAKVLTSNSGNDVMSAVRFDGSGNIYVAGTLNGNVDFDPSTSILNIYSLDKEVFIAKYNSVGTLIFAKSFGGIQDQEATALAIDNNKSIYLTGYFNVSCSFSLNQGGTGITYTTNGGYDIFYAKYDSLSTFVYAKQIGSSVTNESGKSISVDNGGNIYLTGYYTGVADFDPSVSVFTMQPSGNFESFFAKYNSTGNLVYAKTIRSDADQKANCLLLESNGGIYLTGYFNYNVDFDPATNSNYYLEGPSYGSFDAFVARYNTNGDFINVYQMGIYARAYNSSPNNLKRDAAGNIYLFGSSNGIYDFDPSPSTASLVPAASYVAKYTSAGALVYLKRMVLATSFEVDALGNIYVAGGYSGVYDLDLSSNTATVASVANSNDIFFAKYDSNANYIWGKSIGGAFYEYETDMKISPTGEVYITGDIPNVMDFDPSTSTYTLSSSGSDDIFLAKYDASGNFVFADVMGGNNSVDYGRGLALDTSGVYLVGTIQSNSTAVDFDPSSGTATLSSSNTNAFLAKYTLNGAYIFAKLIRGMNSSSSSLLGNSILLDKRGAAYIAGTFVGSCDFDPSTATASLAANASDVFYAKYDINGNYIFAKSFGGSGAERVTGMALDSLNSIYLGGTFQTSVDFDPGPFTTSFVSTSTNNFYVAKYDSIGNFFYAKALPGSIDINNALLIAVNYDGSDLILAGRFTGTVDVDPSPAVASHTTQSYENWNLFLAKYAGCSAAPKAINQTQLLNGSICNNTTASLSAIGNGSLKWYSSPTSTTILSSSNSYVTPSLTIGNYTYYVSITNNCIVNPNQTAIIVTVNPFPTVSVNSGTICSGYSFTITPSGAYNYTVSGYPFIVSPFVNTTYSVTGTNSVGCLSTNTAIASVVVIPSPTVSVANGTICSGQNFTLQPIGATSYSYSSGNAVVSPIATSNYSVTGTGTNGCVSFIAAIANISVNPSPTISVSNGSICTGASYSINPSGANTYSYSGGSAIVSPTVSTTYSITGASIYTCASTVTMQVIVNPLPTLSVNSGTFCSGNSFSIIPSGASSYTISGNSFVVSPSLNTNYSVTGTSSVGCLSTNTAVASVTVINLPTVSVGSGTICNGQSFTLQPLGAANYSYTGGSAVISPSTTSNFLVTGINSFGCISANVAVANIFVKPSPTITANSGSICAGASFSIIPSGALSYTYSGNNSNVSPSTSSVYVVSGTASNACVSSTSVLVTVNPLPTVVVNGGAICIGQSFTLVASGANSYTYSGGTIVSPSITTSYSVNGISSAGCASSNTAVVNVTVNYNPTITVNSGTVCNGASFTLIPNGASTYTYSNGSNIFSATTNTSISVSGTSSAGCVSSNTAIASITVLASPTITVNSGSICSGASFTINPSGASTYSYSSGNAVLSPSTSTVVLVTGTNTLGCVSSNAAVVSITVNASPTITANSGSICAGQSFTINALGAATYTYSSGNNILSPSTNTSVNVIGTSSLGCLSSNIAVVNITVNANPTITVNSGNLCTGSAYTISPNGANNYTFSSGTPIVTPTANTTYSVSGTSSAGCAAIAIAVCSVSVLPLPTVSVNSGTICSGEVFTIVPAGAVSYTFSSGSNLVSPLSTTNYSVMGSSALGCTSATPAISNVFVTPSPSISLAFSPSVICAGETATLNASGASSYTLNGNQFYQGIAITSTAAAQYSVIGIDANGCSAIALITQSVQACAGLSSIGNSYFHARIYPNPNHGEFMIETSLDFEINVFDCLGQQLLCKHIEAGKSHIDIGNFANGVYFIKIKNHNESSIMKLVKE